jgi:hypothetical protein
MTNYMQTTVEGSRDSWENMSVESNQGGVSIVRSMVPNCWDDEETIVDHVFEAEKAAREEKAMAKMRKEKADKKAAKKDQDIQKALKLQEEGKFMGAYSKRLLKELEDDKKKADLKKATEETQKKLLEKQTLQEARKNTTITIVTNAPITSPIKVVPPALKSQEPWTEVKKLNRKEKRALRNSQTQGVDFGYAPTPREAMMQTKTKRVYHAVQPWETREGKAAIALEQAKRMEKKKIDEEKRLALQNHEERTKAFERMGSEQDKNDRLYKTQFCHNVERHGSCNRAECRFYHHIGERRVPMCAFGSVCKFQKTERCRFCHPGETQEGWMKRTNQSLPRGVPKAPTPKTPTPPAEIKMQQPIKIPVTKMNPWIKAPAPQTPPKILTEDKIKDEMVIRCSKDMAATLMLAAMNSGHSNVRVEIVE